jgi:16S rRNA (guanine966-N2)-methyltransferase
MRIVAGKFKGRTFRTKLPNSLRPTSDFTREAIFNMLSNYIDLYETKVLDLFAGTGLLGFEALSRGASFCHFVDKSRASSRIIQQNSDILDLPVNAYKITTSDVFSFLTTYNPVHTFDLVFSDPPYNLSLNSKVINHPKLKNLIHDGTIFVLETSNTETFDYPSEFVFHQRKDYGDTSISILEFSISNKLKG